MYEDEVICGSMDHNCPDCGARLFGSSINCGYCATKPDEKLKNVAQPVGDSRSDYPKLSDVWRLCSNGLPPEQTLCFTYTDRDDYLVQYKKLFWESEYPVNDGNVVAWIPIMPPNFR